MGTLQLENYLTPTTWQCEKNKQGGGYSTITAVRYTSTIEVLKY